MNGIWPDTPELHYDLRVLPPGRFPFRRWRYELWHGGTLLASGWRTSERQAERALETAASWFLHRIAGLHPLRPDSAQVSGRLTTGTIAWLRCGDLRCVLVPRAEAAAG